MADFAALPPAPIPVGQKERHRMYSLCLMSILLAQWNGNKYGATGDYGNWRPSQEIGTLQDQQKVYAGGSYLGHNIAALAIDGEGRIIDYEFNHNDLFDSSVEHAESRLVRRVFALNQIYEPGIHDEGAPGMSGVRDAGEAVLGSDTHRRMFATAVTGRAIEAAPREAVQADPGAPSVPAKPVSYSTLLADVVVYTSLESCAQCSGIMCLGSVKEVVYLQQDQGQFLIGNLMWQATQAQKYGFLAPRPVPGDEFGFEYFSQLNEANDDFAGRVERQPFYAAPSRPPVTTPSVTSFLCTDAALDIYRAAAKELDDWTSADVPDYRPPELPSAMTNRQVLAQVRDFADWVRQLGNRGTPHRV